MKLIRSFVLPWYLFFLVAIGIFIAIGAKKPLFHIEPTPPILAALGLGSFLCLLANLRTLGSVGIWMSESLPDSIRYTSFRWVIRAFKAVIVAAAFWGVGQLPWMPLVWQAAVLPTVFTICLFIFVASLIGPILKFSSNMAWRQAFCVIFSLPVLALVPATALYTGRMMLTAYRDSQPDVVAAAVAAAPADDGPLFGFLGKKKDEPLKGGKNGKKGAQQAQQTPIPATIAPAAPKEPDFANLLHAGKADKRAQAFREMHELPQVCQEHVKDVIAALEPHGPEDVVLWAVKDVSCSDVRTVVGMPKLAAIMTEHPSPVVRAAAIRAMKKYGNENLRTVSYLLFKRLGEHEPPEVIEAAAAVVAPLGPDQQRIATHRLKALLDVKGVSYAAAKSLIQDYGRPDDVATYVSEGLDRDPETQKRATAMICLLPKARRSIAEPHLDKIVRQISTAQQDDPAIKALECLEKPGFKAIRDEMNHPRLIDRGLAAMAFSELSSQGDPEMLETATACARDSNEKVRNLCSRALGEIGAAALPKILELLSSSDKMLRESGRNALAYFNDINAKDELKRIRADNSGWMANNRKLAIAEAVGTALVKIETAQAGPPIPSSLNGGLAGGTSSSTSGKAGVLDGLGKKAAPASVTR